jgi:hypothetical protein
MILTGENRGTGWKTFHNDILSIANSTWADLALNSVLRFYKPTTNDLTHGTTPISY